MNWQTSRVKSLKITASNSLSNDSPRSPDAGTTDDAIALRIAPLSFTGLPGFREIPLIL